MVCRRNAVYRQSFRVKWRVDGDDGSWDQPEAAERELTWGFSVDAAPVLEAIGDPESYPRPELQYTLRAHLADFQRI